MQTRWVAECVLVLCTVWVSIAVFVLISFLLSVSIVAFFICVCLHDFKMIEEDEDFVMIFSQEYWNNIVYVFFHLKSRKRNIVQKYQCPSILIKSYCFVDCNKYSFIRSVSPIFVKSIFMLLILWSLWFLDCVIYFSPFPIIDCT